ncbi:MAG: CAF17-like 4Fe-4S cluster assembly/insertion protein YgfZ [Planctomycetota bacterium]|jgi:aminomethyltransferase
MALVDSHGDPVAEHRAVLEGAGVVDRSDRPRLWIGGGERQTFLQRLVSNDVEALAEGQGCYATLLTPKGKVISDLTIYHRGDRFLIDYPPETREEIAKKLTMYVLSSDVTVEEVTEELGLIAVHGPGAAEVLGVSDPPEALLESTVATIAGHEAVVCRVDYLGVRGFDLHVEREAATEVFEALSGAGATPFGRIAAETLRIEAGVARFGAELGDAVLPPEVPALVDRAISYTKGCYVGQEVVARIKTYGHVNRELRGLAVEGGEVLPPGADVSVEGSPIGAVTSSCVSPTLGRPIALAFLKRAHLETGTSVDVVLGEGTVPAKVVPPGEWEA